jgi:hypothetical protein
MHAFALPGGKNYDVDSIHLGPISYSVGPARRRRVAAQTTLLPPKSLNSPLRHKNALLSPELRLFLPLFGLVITAYIAVTL